ncbi:M12 family metallo-peptidase [Winogradskyella sp.]|uniref:M12 family metallo-peptidase n=1 Tax=Winogradskyella sp. TaxID=1883156 RepID=UPI00262F5F9B|nr:M12 family metallo-peptidase [Winogradskyella sp.]
MNNIRCTLYILLCVIFCLSNLNAQVPAKYSENLVHYKEVKIDINQLKSTLQTAPMKSTVSQNRRSTTVIELPMPSGDKESFRVTESPILSPALSASRPEVKSYVAKGLNDPTAVARFNVTSAGFYGLVKSANGIVVIEKINLLSNDDRYIAYYDHDIIGHSDGFHCESENELTSGSLLPSANRIDSCFQIGDNLRTYELVVTCSGEFYALNGGTDPLVEAALLNRVAQVNTVYETEVATTFTIVEYLLNNNPATDPYSDPTNTFTSISETQTYIDSNVSVSSWDIGHGFHEITCGSSCSFAGRAGLAVVCTSSKARGYTYLPNDIPTSITVLVHEFGHQFSNRHTNYGCNTNNACSRYEPGEGSTIMSTGAGCDAGDFFADRTDYFGITSLQNMIDYQNSGLFVSGTSCGTVTIGGWSDCATITPTGNNMPSSDANANSIDGLVIPHSTPFVLSGSGSDADGTGSLTYNWEQYDTDYSGSDAPDDTAASTTAPLFRSFPPSTSNERTVPQLSSVLAGNVTTGTGEVLPTVARNLTWRLTVRDNEIGGGGVACDQISLIVGSDGPFQITSQNSNTAWVVGATETITWDVANTDSPTYTCANVDILFSSDGGATFPTTLASGVPNNGSYNITVPNVSSSSSRVKIVCSGGTNIFFDINDIDILVTSTCDAVGGTIANSSPVTAIEGDASLNLGLMAGLAVNSVSGTLDASDPNTNLTVENNGGDTCISFGNSPFYETIELVTGTNSNVTFTNTVESYGSVINLFEGSYNPSSVCDNWLNSNANFNGSSVDLNTSFSESLTVGTTYVLLASGFSTNSPNPGNYNVNFGPATLYDVGALNIAGYLYTYVIVNDSSGNIVAFSSDSDLTDDSLFPAADYTVYGLSYLAGSATSGYVGGAFSSLQSDISSTAFCGALSSNSVAVTITGYIPTVYTYNSGTWAPSNPIGTLDSRDQIEIQTGDFTLSSNLECDTVTVNSGASTTIDVGVTLTTNTLNLQSTSLSFSSLILNGSISGTINYHRYTAQVGPTGTNDLIATPFSGQTFGAFDMANSNLAASGSTRAFAPYNTSTGAYENYDSSSNAATILNQGMGYRAATIDGSTLMFSGVVASTDILNIPISDAAAGNAWNLMGNPYPSYLDFDTFFQANSSEFDTQTEFQAIYGYDGNASNGWTVWNQATIDEGSITELIAPGQGFFVKSKTSGGLVDFTTAMRRTGSSDDFILGRPSPSNVALCQLYMTSNTDTSTTQLYFIEGTTRGLDVGYDAGAFRGNAGTFSIFSNLVEDNVGIDMAIQTLPFDDLNDVVIPLGIHATATTQLTIGVSNTSTIPEDINIYLEDTEENTFILLNTSDYIFTPNTELNGTGRFYLWFISQTLSENEDKLNHLQVFAITNPKTLVIKGHLNSETIAKLYDVQGRLVLSSVLNESVTTNTINVGYMHSGVYIVEITNDNGTKTQKLIIR